MRPFIPREIDPSPEDSETDHYFIQRSASSNLHIITPFSGPCSHCILGVNNSCNKMPYAAPFSSLLGSTPTANQAEAFQCFFFFETAFECFFQLYTGQTQTSLTRPSSPPTVASSWAEPQKAAQSLSRVGIGTQQARLFVRSYTRGHAMHAATARHGPWQDWTMCQWACGTRVHATS